MCPVLIWIDTFLKMEHCDATKNRTLRNAILTKEYPEATIYLYE